MRDNEKNEEQNQPNETEKKFQVEVTNSNSNSQQSLEKKEANLSPVFNINNNNSLINIKPPTKEEVASATERKAEVETITPKKNSTKVCRKLFNDSPEEKNEQGKKVPLEVPLPKRPVRRKLFDDDVAEVKNEIPNEIEQKTKSPAKKITSTSTHHSLSMQMSKISLPQKRNDIEREEPQAKKIKINEETEVVSLSESISMEKNSPIAKKVKLKEATKLSPEVDAQLDKLFDQFLQSLKINKGPEIVTTNLTYMDLLEQQVKEEREEIEANKENFDPEENCEEVTTRRMTAFPSYFKSKPMPIKNGKQSDNEKLLDKKSIRHYR